MVFKTGSPSQSFLPKISQATSPRLPPIGIGSSQPLTMNPLTQIADQPRSMSPTSLARGLLSPQNPISPTSVGPSISARMEQEPSQEHLAYNEFARLPYLQPQKPNNMSPVLMPLPLASDPSAIPSEILQPGKIPWEKAKELEKQIQAELQIELAKLREFEKEQQKNQGDQKDCKDDKTEDQAKEQEESEKHVENDVSAIPWPEEDSSPVMQARHFPPVAEFGTNSKSLHHIRIIQISKTNRFSTIK